MLILKHKSDLMWPLKTFESEYTSFYEKIISLYCQHWFKVFNWDVEELTSLIHVYCVLKLMPSCGFVQHKYYVMWKYLNICILCTVEGCTLICTVLPMYYKLDVEKFKINLWLIEF